jgi:hypothetical protein
MILRKAGLSHRIAANNHEYETEVSTENVSDAP